MIPPSEPRPAPATLRDARLRYVLSAVPDLYRPQPVDALMDRLLRLGATLSGAELGLVALLADHDLVTRRAPIEGMADLQDPVSLQETPLVVRAVRGLAVEPGADLLGVTGRFREPALRAVYRDDPQVAGEVVALPVRLGRRAVGALVLETTAPADLPALEEAAYHVSEALQNLVLFAAGTGMMPAGYDQAVRMRLEQTLRADYRRGDPCAVLCASIVDLDGIRRRSGRRIADAVVFHLGQLLRQVARETDTVGRSGPGELMVILPSTPGEGASIFAARLGADVHRMVVEAPETTYQVDVGIASLPAYDGSLGPVPRELFEALTAAFMEAAREAVAAGRATGTGVPIVECGWSTLAHEALRG